MDFFRRLAEKGCSFVWCNEAVVYELVPSSRCTRSYLLKRALLRGRNSQNNPAHPVREAGKTLLAIVCYALALPVFAAFGQYLFLKYLAKLLYHIARFPMLLGFKPATQRSM